MSRTIPSPEALTADPCYRGLKDHVIESTGLAYYLDKDHDLAEKIGKRLAALDISGCAAYLALLRDGHAGEVELDELVADLTIGETYFFRHEEQFEALRRTVLPDILRKNAARRQIRIWSAGCATGAEAYSLGILLRREFAGPLAGWDVSILGTDINRKFLAQARDGRFGDWALRSTGEDVKSACFSRSNNAWRVLDEYREGISFQYHNLVKHPYPSLLHNLAAFDLILCRNVMIYFSREVIAACVDRFRGCLVDGGWLLVGYAETNPECFRSFHAVTSPGTLLFERTAQAAASPSETPGALFANPPQERVESAAPWQPPSLPELPPLLRREPTPMRTEATPDTDSKTAKIRDLADRAQWREAVELCRTLIEKDALDPIGHFYHALVLEQMGHGREAETAINRAIYLDRNSVLAHYHKGLMLQKGKDAAGAARSFRNVLDLLKPLSSETRFTEADGISATDLAELAQMQIDILERP